MNEGNSSMSKFEESFEKAMRAAQKPAQHESEGGQFEVYDPLTGFETSAAHFGRPMSGRYYTSRTAAEADAADMTSYHKRPFKVRQAGAPEAPDSPLPPRDMGFEWVEFDARGRSVNLQRGFRTLESALRAAQDHSKSKPKSHHVDVFRDILRGPKQEKLARFRAGAPNPGLGHHRKTGPDLSHYSRPGAPGKVHLTERYKRIRLHDPSEFEPGSFRTIDPGRPGHTKLIVARPKGSKKMRVQAILKSRG